MARTVIVNPKTEESGDDTALWIIMLVAFAVVLFAIIGFNRGGATPSVTSGNSTTHTQTTTTTTR